MRTSLYHQFYYLWKLPLPYSEFLEAVLFLQLLNGFLFFWGWIVKSLWWPVSLWVIHMISFLEAFAEVVLQFGMASPTLPLLLFPLKSQHTHSFSLFTQTYTSTFTLNTIYQWGLPWPKNYINSLIFRRYPFYYFFISVCNYTFFWLFY